MYDWAQFNPRPPLAGPSMTELTTTQAAYLVGISPKSFAKWAKARGITPTRAGRTSLWELANIIASNTPETALDKRDH